MTPRTLAVFTGSVLTVAGVSRAQVVAPAAPPAPPAAEPVAAPAAIAAFATVVTVKGKCDCRQSATEAFAPAKQGMQLLDGAEFRTGIGGAVQILVGQSQLLTIDRLGYVKLLEAVKDGGTDRTRIGLERGRINFNVDSTQVKNDIKIQAPDMTLAITGTSGGAEVADGFPTRAFGDAENTGRFTVTYANGRQAEIRRAGRTDADAPRPAFVRWLMANLDSGDVRSRDNDERRVVLRSGGQPVGLINQDLAPGSPQVPDPTPPFPIVEIVLDLMYFIDTLTGDLYISGTDLRPSLLRADFDPGTLSSGIGGTAILSRPAENKRTLIQMDLDPQSGETSFSHRVVGFDIFPDGSTGPMVDFGSFTATQTNFALLTGLGALGDALYAVGLNESGSGLYSIDLAAHVVDQLAQFDFDVSGGLAGSNERGTLFMMAGAGNGDGQVGPDALLEFDPRTTYLRTVFTDENGDFDIRPGTNNEAGVIFERSNLILTGMAVVDGQVIFSLLGDTGQGSTTGAGVFVRFDPSASGTDANPHMSQITDIPPVLIAGLASESLETPAASQPLSNPAGAQDTRFIDPFLAQLAYSQQAVSSGFLKNILKEQIINSSISPTACSISPDLDTLQSHLEAHVDQVNGFARAVADFRQSISLQHPCQCPTSDAVQFQ